jgi:hypothetical protein
VPKTTRRRARARGATLSNFFKSPERVTRPPASTRPPRASSRATAPQPPDALWASGSSSGARDRRVFPGLVAAKARRRAQELHRGRQRARDRVDRGTFGVHPGWRGRVPAEFAILTDQGRAIARATELVGDQLWSPRQRREWLAMLTAMAHRMDWEGQPDRPARPRHPGLIKGLTRDELAKVVGRSPTTVSRLWAWAQDVGLLVRVEEGAPKQWLGSKHNRAAVFAFVASRDDVSSQLIDPVDKDGDHPQSCVSNYPLRTTERLKQATTSNSTPSWPLFAIPATPAEREAASRLLLTRAGLDVRGVDYRRVRGALKQWWLAGACVAGLLWAVDHHPDRPAHSRGDAFRAARDQVALLGYRLAPWQDRLHELPAAVTGHRGDYRSVQAERLTERLRIAEQAEVYHSPTSTSATREAAKVALAGHLSVRTKRRRTAQGPDVNPFPGRW